MYQIILDFGRSGQYGLGIVTEIVGTAPYPSVSEANEPDNTKIVLNFLMMLRECNPRGDAQLFLKEDGVGAWYDVDCIRWDDARHICYVVAGEVRATS
jgi:nitrous oxide reductase accessory protein NosL